MYTFRRSYSNSGAKGTFADGIQSILSVAGFLTMHEVNGYEGEPEKPLLAAADQGLFSQLSLIMAPTITATMSQEGYGFKNPMVIIKRGLLSINRKIIRFFHKKRHTDYKTLSTFAEKRLEKEGCPVGRRMRGNTYSGIDILAKLFSRLAAA